MANCKGCGKFVSCGCQLDAQGQCAACRQKRQRKDLIRQSSGKPQPLKP